MFNSRTHLLEALLFAMMGFIFAIFMTLLVLERLPHLEDEMTYLFQARTYARNVLWAPPAPVAGFGVPFTLNFGEYVVGKYPIGWPLVLSLGERFGVGWIVNPIFGGLTAGLIYLIAYQLFDRQVARVSGILTVTSPFYLIQSGTYMSHASGAFWVTLLYWCFLQLEMCIERENLDRLWIVVAGVSLGMLTLTRYLTAAIMIGALGGMLIYRLSKKQIMVRQMMTVYLPVFILGGLIGLLQPLYLYRVTGSPITNLYTLYWDYDKIGFGPGFGFGDGHTFWQGLVNIQGDLILWSSELFGWWYISWIPLAIGVVIAWRTLKGKKATWPLVFILPFILTVLIHIGYWVGASVYGPRYYYESFSGIVILSAVGLCWIGQTLSESFTTFSRKWVSRTVILVVILLVINLATYLPSRIAFWHGMYGIKRETITELESLIQTDKVLILVQGSAWVEYGAYSAYNSPWLDDPIIAGRVTSAQREEEILSVFSDREVWYVLDGEFSKEPFPYTEEE